EADAVAVDEVAVVQGLQAQIGELGIALCHQGIAEYIQVKFQQFRRQQFQLHTFFNIGAQYSGVTVVHLALGCAVGQAEETEGLTAQCIQQQTGGYVGGVRILFNQGTGSHHRRGAYVFQFRTRVEGAQGFFVDGIGSHAFQANTGLVDNGAQTYSVQRTLGTIRVGNLNAGFRRLFTSALVFTQTCVFSTIQNVGAGHLVFAGTHQCQFNLVLDFLNVDGTAGRHTTLEDRGDLGSHLGDGFAYACRCCSRTAFYSQIGLGDRDHNFGFIIGNHSTIALDNS